MDYEGLRDFIRRRMRMTHIYQPLMIRTILESDGGSATVGDIASSFVGQDRAYLEYYKKIVKRWPHDTLVRKQKVAEYDRGSQSYRLRLDVELSDEQRAELIALCDYRLEEFLDRDYWILGRRVTPERMALSNLRYDILAKSKGVCVACGTPATKTPLDIDHIVPIARGGADVPDNMQALCFRCNRQKRDRDATDFLLWHKQIQFAKSPKCRTCAGRHGAGPHNHMAFAVTEGDCFVAPIRHVRSFSEMILAERQLCMALVHSVVEDLRIKSPAARFGIDGMYDSDAEHCRISIVQE